MATRSVSLDSSYDVCTIPQFRLLGPLEVVGNDRGLRAPTAPKTRQVLALLAMRRNTVVRNDEFIDELWETNPPSSAMTTLQTYIYKLRKLLTPAGSTSMLTTKPGGGYVLEIPDEAMDIARFEALAEAGREAGARGDAEATAELLTQALSVWRGEVLGDVEKGPLLAAYTARLEEERFRVREMRIEAELQLGRHLELIAELKALTLDYPLNEKFHSTLMVALDRAGRRYEALEVYHRLRGHMVDELGLEPDIEVQELHQNLITGHSTPLAPAHQVSVIHEPAVPEARPSASRPLEVPAPPPDYFSRPALEKKCLQGLEGPDPFLHIVGTPKAGKSALAKRVAALVKDDFPGGQIYAEFDDSISKGEVLRVVHGALSSLGVAEGDLPAHLGASANMLRSVSENRRVLFVLDGVHHFSQVRPLMPSASNGILVTSRHLLEEVPSACVTVGPMRGEGGLGFFVSLLDRDLSPADLEAAAEIVRFVDGLPGALRCVAQWADRHGEPLELVLTQLAEAVPGWDIESLSEVYDEVLKSLRAPELRTLLLLLSTTSWTYFTVVRVVDAFGVPSATVHALITHLQRCGQLFVDRAEDQSPLYRLPNLLRVHLQRGVLSMGA
ncbi:hypothetical protein CGZ98_03665 [Enemella evansiae]|uniref:AfsR/SARP family transcriptional regulator n=1 Tax=Enemella evansiae TaxID=2016499 RepID=UPI000B97AC60|nr:AfsR/SARP family transcriptional regulator [Enemella evansiae]OYO15516.1 hypothetical protein CGZ98_03665 [Enemella evansiae]